VRVSFDVPEYTADADAMGTLRLLDAIREEGVECRFYQASSSEMFGQAEEIPQRETTPFHPRSPYGVAKVFSYWITRNYREAYGMYAVNGILFNHESPRRGPTFVTRKITRALGAILRGEQSDHHAFGAPWKPASPYIAFPSCTGRKSSFVKKNSEVSTFASVHAGAPLNSIHQTTDSQRFGWEKGQVNLRMLRNVYRTWDLGMQEKVAAQGYNHINGRIELEPLVVKVASHPHD